MQTPLLCPECNALVRKHANPAPTVDVIIYEENQGIVLIERLNTPFGYAIPGGFIDINEQVEFAAKREMKEETNLDVELIGVLGVYSNPNRDPRFHTMSTVFVAKAVDISQLKAGDDAKNTKLYPLDEIPNNMCFDHGKIIEDFKKYLKNERNLCPIED